MPRILGSVAMIARYTRPEIGAIWTDEARFGAMRDVEVAAAEALDGPTAEELDAIRAATFTVDAINEREKLLDHDTAAFVDVLGRPRAPRAAGSTTGSPRPTSSTPASRCSCSGRVRCSS